MLKLASMGVALLTTMGVPQASGRAVSAAQSPGAELMATLRKQGITRLCASVRMTRDGRIAIGRSTGSDRLDQLVVASIQKDPQEYKEAKRILSSTQRPQDTMPIAVNTWNSVYQHDHKIPDKIIGCGSTEVPSSNSRSGTP